MTSIVTEIKRTLQGTGEKQGAGSLLYGPSALISWMLQNAKLQEWDLGL